MICLNCNIDKNEDEFSFKNKNTGKRQPRCKDCIKEYRKTYYENNKSVAIAYARISTQNIKVRNYKYIFDYLANYPCVDCGETDPIVLEFDHRDGVDKVEDISTAIRNGWSIERLKEEIDKCDIRCANCHRRRTAKQLNWYKCLQ